MRNHETKFELDITNEPETDGEMPAPQAADADAWAALSDVPFAGEQTDEQLVQEMEDAIPDQDIAATEQAASELEQMADEIGQEATESQPDADDGLAQENAVFDVSTGEWVADADCGDLADAPSAEISDSTDYSGLTDSTDAGDSDSSDAGSLF